MKPPLVSVLLPTHNRRDVVGFAIESALAQTLTDFELLVCGDGCTDGTADLVRQYRDPRVIWHDWPKAPGFGYANRNRSLRHARGTFIAHLAHDDLWLPDHLVRMTGLLSATGAEWASCAMLLVSRAGRISPVAFDLRDPRTRRRWREQHVGAVASTSVVHRRSCLDAYGGFNERVERGGDLELWLRILDGRGWRAFAFDPTPSYLRFVANWRSITWRSRMMDRVAGWERPGAPELRPLVPAGVTEQEAICRAMLRAPVEWVSRMRDGAARELEGGFFARPASSLLNALQACRVRVIARRYQWPPYAASGPDRPST